MNSSTARLRMFEFLQNQRRCTFTYHEPIAIAIERSRCRLWSIISCAGCEQSIEDGGFEIAEFIGAADYHHVLHSVADSLGAVPNCMAPRSARARGWNDSPGHSEKESYIDSRRLTHHLKIAGGGYLVGSPSHHQLCETQDRFRT